MKRELTVNGRTVSMCMLAMSAFAVIVVLIAEMALVAAFIAAVINDTHPLIFVFSLGSLVLAALFLVSLRVLSMELEEYRRCAAIGGDPYLTGHRMA